MARYYNLATRDWVEVEDSTPNLGAMQREQERKRVESVVQPFAFTRYNVGITKLFDSLPRPKSLREYVKGQKYTAQFASKSFALQQFGARYSAVASPSFIAAVGQGFSTATTVADLAKVGGPKAAAVGAAIGFMGGLIGGLIPTERNEAEAKWDAVVAAMPPIDRYLVFAGVRPIANNNCRQQGIVLPGGTPFDPCGPWRWADDPEGGHSPWGGPVGRTVNLLERLCRQPVVPATVANDTLEQKSQLALYILLFMAGAHDDRRMPWQMRAMWPLIADGKVAPPLVAEFGPYSNIRLGELRRIAVLRGIRDIWNPILTPSLRVELGKP